MLKMIKFTLNGMERQAPEGQLVIDAAKDAGIEIPHYCYHPALGNPGNCRMCIVEVAGAPKPSVACRTGVREGMVVSSDSEAAMRAQASALELHLLNHPLDCPVCDQSGECGLQDYYMKIGKYQSAVREDKDHKNKRVVAGPHVMLDAERCILCTRCTRFVDNITKTHELGIFGRGHDETIAVSPGMTLDNAYSGNVVDICPVGALTDRHFRYKVRVWYLEETDSICTGCARGCNVDVHYVLDRPYLADGARVMRLKPRVNPEVNQWWMCDEGRYGYKFMDEGRLRKVLFRGRETTWENAMAELAAGLAAAKAEAAQARVGVIPSPQLTTEELFLIRKIFREALGIPQVSAGVPAQPGYSDSFLIQADKNPNSAAAALMGMLDLQASQIIDRALAGEIRALWVFGHDLVKLYGEEKVKRLAEKLRVFIFQGSNENGTCRYAHWVLPGAVAIEKDGTFVNCGGRVQRIGRALQPLQGSRPDWEILLDLAGRLGIPLAMRSPEEIFAAAAQEIPALAGLSYESIGWQGRQAGRQGEEAHRG